VMSAKRAEYLHILSESYTPKATSRRSWVDTLNFILSVLHSQPQEIVTLQECERIKHWLSELLTGAGHTGLRHYNFETDNVFYNRY
jgi:hypothetical protein